MLEPTCPENLVPIDKDRCVVVEDLEQLQAVAGTVLFSRVGAHCARGPVEIPGPVAAGVRAQEDVAAGDGEGVVVDAGGAAAEAIG